MKTRIAVAIAMLSFIFGVNAARAADPKFDHRNIEEVKTVEWKAQAQAGLLINSGNSNIVSFSGGGSASRNDGKNKISLDLGGAYAKSTLVSATDANGDGTISPLEITRAQKLTTALWNVKLRYDRFLTANNILYVAAQAYGNEPAGKTVAAGLQGGYARQLYKSEWQLLATELGYDYTYEHYVAVTPDLHIHSLRLFLAYALTLSKATAINADVEVLCNLNPEDNLGGGRTASPFEDTRVNGRIALTTKLWKAISFRFGFTARYDNVAPLAPTLGLPYAAGFFPVAEKLDTITDASLIVTFL